MIQDKLPLTVFTVDDSEIVYKNMHSVLLGNKNITWLGHAFNLPDAYAQIGKKNPDLIILDIQLKEHSSFVLLEYLSNSHPDTVVIMFTNLASPPYREKCEKLGAKYFLDKSVEFEKIPQIIEDLLTRK